MPPRDDCPACHALCMSVRGRSCTCQYTCHRRMRKRYPPVNAVTRGCSRFDFRPRNAVPWFNGLQKNTFLLFMYRFSFFVLVLTLVVPTASKTQPHANVSGRRIRPHPPNRPPNSRQTTQETTPSPQDHATQSRITRFTSTSHPEHTRTGQHEKMHQLHVKNDGRETLRPESEERNDRADRKTKKTQESRTQYLRM